MDTGDSHKMKETDVIKKTIKMLERQYGFDKDQIKQEVKIYKSDDQKAIADIVVYRKEKGKITKDVTLVVEVKSGPLLSPLYENQLKITMSSLDAQYGMIFNGEEKSCISQEIDEDVKSLHEKNVSDFGEFTIIADIPVKKKIKNKPKREIYLDNFAHSKIAEIRNFLDRVLETKSSHNFLIYFMIQAKTGLILNDFEGFPYKKLEFIHAMIRTFPERFEEIDRKKIMEWDDVSKLTKKEKMVIAEQIQNKATKLTKNELLVWADLLLLNKDEEKFIKKQLELIEKKDLKSLLHFIGLFEVEEIELLSMEKYFRELPLPNQIERYAVIWRALLSHLHSKSKKGHMLLAYFSPLFEYVHENVNDDLGFAQSLDRQSRHPELGAVISAGPNDGWGVITLYGGWMPKYSTTDEDLNELYFKTIGGTNNFTGQNIDPLTFDNKRRYKTYLKGGECSEQKIEELPKYNSIIALPPFGKKIDHSLNKDLKKHGINEAHEIYYFILHMIELLNEGGIFAVVVPPSFLFAGSGITRKKISDACNVLGLIQFPSGYFPEHMVGGCLMLLEKKEKLKEQTEKIFVYNIPHQTNPINYDKIFKETILKFKKYRDSGKIENVNYDEINFELDIKELDRTWYIWDKTPYFKKLTEIKNAVKLEDVSIIFSPLIPKNELKNRDDGKVVDFLRISDLEKNEIKSTIKVQKVVSNEFYRKSSMFLKDGDFVLSRQATIGKIAVVKTNGRKIISSPQLVVIRPEKNKIDPEYLLFALKNEKTQEQMRLAAKGNFVRRVSTESIKKIMISVPPLSEQKRKSKKIRESKRKIEELETKIRAEKENMEKIQNE